MRLYHIGGELGAYRYSRIDLQLGLPYYGASQLTHEKTLRPLIASQTKKVAQSGVLPDSGRSPFEHHSCHHL